MIIGRSDRVRTLRPINCVADLAPPAIVGVFNACSIGNKSASINHWIAESSLRLAAVVETWHDSLACPDLIACAPPGYHYIERARPRSATSAKQPWWCLPVLPLLFTCQASNVH